jgi:hypothetical protein
MFSSKNVISSLVKYMKSNQTLLASKNIKLKSRMKKKKQKKDDKHNVYPNLMPAFRFAMIPKDKNTTFDERRDQLIH